VVDENLEKYDDVRLFEMLSFGGSESEKAFMELYRRYSGRIFAYCRRFLGNREDALDVFQDTFIRFFESAKQERTMTNVPAFLLRIARNLCLNFKRQSRKMTTIEDYMQYETYENNSSRDELMELIKIALAELPDDYREAFILREYEGMTYNEISEFLGISLALVKIRIFRAKQKIREILAPYISELSKM
jgi:RNA polymerase sigma-70 factor (ECF subfamily)